MENLEDKDKTIAILRHQYSKALKEIQVQRMDLAKSEFEIEKLRKIAHLENEEEYIIAIYGITSIEE